MQICTDVTAATLLSGGCWVKLRIHGNRVGAYLLNPFKILEEPKFYTYEKPIWISKAIDPNVGLSKVRGSHLYESKNDPLDNSYHYSLKLGLKVVLRWLIVHSIDLKMALLATRINS